MSPGASTELSAAPRGPCIVGPAYDAVFFLLAPMLALGLGFALHSVGASDVEGSFGGQRRRWIDVGVGVLIHAHLVAVVARSHLDPGTFRRFPLRFVVVPALLYVGMLASAWVTAAAIVVATFWDVYHSGAQTFGLARMFDRRAGRVDDASSRRWDAALNQALYAGPIAAGVTLAAHLESFEAFAEVDGPVAALLARVPEQDRSVHGGLATAVLAAGAALVAGYVLRQVRQRGTGAAISPRAAFLVASTGIVSLVTWSTNPWGEAFFVMNAFHAVQYLALIHATESPKLARRFLGRDDAGARRKVLAAALFAFAGYGLFVEWLDPSRHALWSLTMVVSLMHFWYDGFLWSVRRGEA